MEGVEEEKDAQFSSEAGLLKSHEPPLVEEYILEPRTSLRVSPIANAEALKTPVAKAPETPKKTPAKMSWSAKGLTPSPKSSEKETPAKAATPKAATKVATPKKTPAKVLVTPRRSLGRAATPKVVQKATPAKKTPAKAATPKAATKVATPKSVKATPKKTPAKAATPK